jgi:hypothetical protein
MATRKTAAAKVAATVSPEPDQHDAGGVPDDVTVVVPDGDGDMEDAPPPAPAPAAPAPAATTPGGALNAGDPTGYATWVVPAPAALATAPVGSSGYYMDIKVGVDTKTGPFAGWLGTAGPRPNWPN